MIKNHIKIIISLVILIILAISFYHFCATLSQIKGTPVSPFINNQFVLSEKISYHFLSPKIGDRILFIPENLNMDFIGIVTKIATNTNNENVYYVASSDINNPWLIRKQNINAKIYYPLMSNEEVLASLPLAQSQTIPTIPQITPTFSPSSFITPTPSPDIKVIDVTINPSQQSASPTPQAPQAQPFIKVEVYGTVYRDENCNNFRENNEVGIPNTTINIFKNPEFYILAKVVSGNEGKFSWTTEIQADQYIDVGIGAVSPAGYSSNPRFGDAAIRLKASYPKAEFLIPQVPYENRGKCQQYLPQTP